MKSRARLINEINTLRRKLGNAFQNRLPYDEVYKLSIELDELINFYYEK